MINQIQNAEALNSANYVDNYIDSVEHLPDDVQRQLSRIRDIDVQYRGYLRDIEHYYDLWHSLKNEPQRRTRYMARMQQNLIQAQELGDEKMHIINQLQEIIDLKTRRLDVDQRNLNINSDLQQLHPRVEQLQQQQQVEFDYGPSSTKQQRLQSPMRTASEFSVNSNSGGIKDHNGNSYGSYNAGGSCSSGGGSTPNSERSGHISSNALALAGIIPNSSNISSVMGNDGGRINKRSRRRADTVNALSSVHNNINIELMANESNSATDGNSNGLISGAGGERQQKSNLSSSHKKHNVQQGSGGGLGSSQIGAGGVSAGSGGHNSGKKKKARKSRGTMSTSSTAATNAREDTPPPDPIDPDEPTYCICNQISFGEMILCDNDLCPIEWFHFSCVQLHSKPKGRWFCPNCRGDRQNVMKPKAQFLKELERFNREREDKT